MLPGWLFEPCRLSPATPFTDTGRGGTAFMHYWKKHSGDAEPEAQDSPTRLWRSSRHANSRGFLSLVCRRVWSSSCLGDINVLLWSRSSNPIPIRHLLYRSNRQQEVIVFQGIPQGAILSQCVEKRESLLYLGYCSFVTSSAIVSRVSNSASHTCFCLLYA